jgi:hypothetical protein
MLISLFLPWVDFMIFSTSLIGIPGAFSDLAGLSGIGEPPFTAQLALYVGYAFFSLGAAGLFFNYKGDIQKSKLAYYAMIGYFILVIILNISDISDISGGSDGGPSIFSILGMGFYVFIASFIGTFKFLKEENNPEVID